MRLRVPARDLVRSNRASKWLCHLSMHASDRRDLYSTKALYMPYTSCSHQTSILKPVLGNSKGLPIQVAPDVRRQFRQSLKSGQGWLKTELIGSSHSYKIFGTKQNNGICTGFAACKHDWHRSSGYRAPVSKFPDRIRNFGKQILGKIKGTIAETLVKSGG